MAFLKYLLLLCTLILNANVSAQIAVSLSKMNVLYPVVENLVTLVSSDLPDSNLLLVPSLGEIRRKSPEHYVWTICHRDTNFAMLEIRDRKADTLVQTFSFRLKKIPEPVPLLGARHKSSVMPNGEYCSSRGLAMVIENFDFELRCDIVHYDVQYEPKGWDAVVKRNEGARFNSEVINIINRAKPGDKYYFYNIAYRCGCDPMIRHLSEELNFIIK